MKLLIGKNPVISYLLIGIILTFSTGCKETKCRKGKHDWIIDCINNKKPKGYAISFWVDQCKQLASQEFCYEVKKHK